MQIMKVGDKVRLSYCDDPTVYEIDRVLLRNGSKIYHLRDVQGLKAEGNLMAV